MKDQYGIHSNPLPAPQPASHPFGVEGLDQITPATRQAANQTAQQELKKDNPDLEILRKYSGGGGLGESLNEFYTPPAVVAAMYAAAGSLNQNLSILDLACGTGSLLAQAPEGSKLVGVELNETSAHIAKKLLPHAAIHQLSAEEYLTQSTDELFDLCIINPPFGVRAAAHLDPTAHHIKTNEHYFVQKALERVKYGSGLVIALVNLNLVGSEHHNLWRHTISMYGQVINAVAVPQQAFEKAGAQVSTAILVIRRHDIGVREALGLLSMKQLKQTLDEHNHHSWYSFLSGRLLYQPTEDQGYQFTQSYRYHYRLSEVDKLTTNHFDQPLYQGEIQTSPEHLDNIREHTNLWKQPITLHQILGQIKTYSPDLFQQAQSAASKASTFPIPLGTKNPEGTWLMTPQGWQPHDDFLAPEIQAALTIASLLNQMIDVNGVQQLHITKRLQTLATSYKKEYGAFPRERLEQLAGRVPIFGLLVAQLDQTDQLIIEEQSDIPLALKGNLQEIAAQLSDLLLLTEQHLSYYAHCDLHTAEQHLLKHYCWTGELWLPPALYYCGNPFLKAEQCRLQAKNTAKGIRQQALLRQAQIFTTHIQQTTLEDLQISPRDPLIPLEVLETWVNQYLDSIRHGEHLIAVHREGEAVKLLLASKRERHQHLANRQAINPAAVKALGHYLNFSTKLKRIEQAKEMSARDYQAERAAAMEEAQEYEERLQQHFQSWLPSSGYADQVLHLLQSSRGRYLISEGITKELPLKDWQGPSGHPYQCMDVRTMAATNGMILGYDVGLGKTYTTLLLISYLKMLGQITRPVVVVPAGLIANWSTNAAKALPNWNILTIGMSPATHPGGTPKYKQNADGKIIQDEHGDPIQIWTEDSPKTKKLKLGHLTTGQFDLIIMSREAFSAIPLSDQTLTRLIAQDPQLCADIERKEQFEERGRNQRRDLLAKKESFEAKCRLKLAKAHSTDLFFERLGIDFIAYDECHAYKNLYAAPTYMSEVPKFLGAGAESNRALDAVFKGRLVRQRGGKTFGLSASWVKNSPLEMHAMYNLICDDLPRYGFATNEAMLNRYIRIEPKIITTLDGDVDIRPTVTGFKRGRELKSIIDARIIARSAGQKEVTTRDGHPLHVPTIKTEEVMFDMSPPQLEAHEEYRQQALLAAGQKEGEAHLFSVMWRMRKLAADPALLDFDFPNPRFEAFAQQALRVRNMGRKSLGFLSIGEKEGSFQRLKEVLIANGYPEHEIEIVSSGSHKSSVARKNLEDRYNYGEITLIIGSEILAEGFNLQHGTGAIIHADIPWNYEGIKQRNGRGGRQGNTFDEVLCVFLLQRGGFDAITYTIMKGKKAWKDQLDGSMDEIEHSGEAFGADEMAIMLSEDPEGMQKRIVQKKKQLEEASGAALFRRKLGAIYQIYTTRQLLLKRRHSANQRKNGWTANDHLKVTLLKQELKNKLRDLENTDDFPLAKMIWFKWEIVWSHSLPFHCGMGFEMDDQHWTIHSVNTEYVTAKNTESDEPRLFKMHTVARIGHSFTPSTTETDFQDPHDTTQEKALQILPAQDLNIHVMTGPNTKPAPQDPERMTLTFNDRTIGLLNHPTHHQIQHEFSQGNTVVHLLLSQESNHLKLKHAVVLCPDSTTTQEIKESGSAFREQLLNMTHQALAG